MLLENPLGCPLVTLGIIGEVMVHGLASVTFHGGSMDGQEARSKATYPVGNGPSCGWVFFLEFRVSDPDRRSSICGRILMLE